MTDITNAAFWDRIAPKYAKSKISDTDAYETTLARTRTYLDAHSKVVEMGCGTGTTALKLFSGTASYEATDISTGMIDIANEKVETMADPKPTFRVAGTQAADYASQDVNTVLAFNLLHLVTDLEAMLVDVHAILPKDGVFISKTPALAEKWYFGPMIRIMRLVGKAPYCRTLGVDQLDHMIEAAGFRIVETGLYPPKLPSRFIVARKI